MKIKKLLKTIIKIDGESYYPSKKRPKLGQYILDKKDGLYGKVDAIIDKNHIVVRDGVAAEIGVPINRVYSLHLKKHHNEQTN